MDTEDLRVVTALVMVVTVLLVLPFLERTEAPPTIEDVTGAVETAASTTSETRGTVATAPTAAATTSFFDRAESLTLDTVLSILLSRVGAAKTEELRLSGNGETGELEELHFEFRGR